MKCAEDLQQYHLIIEAEASSISRVCGGIFVARLPCDRRCARHRCGLLLKLCFFFKKLLLLKEFEEVALKYNPAHTDHSPWITFMLKNKIMILRTALDLQVP